MAYSTQYTASQDAGFRQRLQIAMAKIASDVAGEAYGGNAVNHRKRHDLSVSVLRSPGDWLDQFAFAVVADDVTGTASSDTDLNNRLSALWNDMAGVGIDIS